MNLKQETDMADTQALVNQLNECAEKQDFEGAVRLIHSNLADFSKGLNAVGVKDALKKTTKDRLLLSFVEGVEFGSVPLDKSLVRLEKLVSFQPGARVLNATWGLGMVKRLDYFYRRITVDFKTRKGHQFSYAAAVDMLTCAPEGHILVTQAADPAAFEQMLKERPAEFVKAVLTSYGDMPVTRLEDICIANGFVKKVNWKKFWEAARTELRKDKLVEIPARRAEPIRLKEAVEDYGDGWLTAFSHETDPKLILAGVREYVAQGKFKTADDATKAKLGDRLAFAVTAARKVDDALYARLACQVIELGFATPPAAEMRAYLWERKRFIKAAAALPSREVGAMITFLAENEAAKARLYAAIPEFGFTAVTEVVSQFKNEHPCRQAVGALLKESQAPATLVTLLVGKIEQFGEFKYADVDIGGGKKVRTLKGYALWEELPALTTILTHAIALGEGRRGGETLRMQNLVRRLFADKAWLAKMFSLLSATERVLVFERFQASIAWDPSTHHTIVVRMTRIVPELEAHVVKVEKKREYARETSFRSYALRKAEYLRLISEEMPENVRKIEFAKGFGDLSENAEYQYAKDEQRQLMQKQTLMQAELEAVRPTDFATATTDEIMPGVTVAIETPEGEKTYYILGEWDNDLEKGIISSKARLALNLLGKKPGDQFELPGAEGQIAFGKVRAVEALPAEIREWIKLPVGMQI
ncbi:MAG: GreA/GreB family elongation factor [Kiritimatiellia bacterium]